MATGSVFERLSTVDVKRADASTVEAAVAEKPAVVHELEITLTDEDKEWLGSAKSPF